MPLCSEEGVIRWLPTNGTILHSGSSSRRHEICVYSYPFIRFCRISFSEQRQMEGVIQNDQTPETHKTEGTKGYRKQEAPWRPRSRTKCVDELMHWSLQRPKEAEGKTSIWIYYFKAISIEKYLHNRKMRISSGICMFFFLPQLCTLLCLELLHALKGVHLLWLLSMFPTWFCG